MINELADIKGKLGNTKFERNEAVQRIETRNNQNKEGNTGNARINSQNNANQNETMERTNNRKRENNIILYNVTESEHQDLDTRIKRDEGIVTGIIDFMNITDIEVLKVRRLVMVAIQK